MEAAAATGAGGVWLAAGVDVAEADGVCAGDTVADGEVEGAAEGLGIGVAEALGAGVIEAEGLGLGLGLGLLFFVATGFVCVLRGVGLGPVNILLILSPSVSSSSCVPRA